MKNRLAKILFAILTVLATSCQKEKEPEIIKVTDVTLDITSLSLIEGESQTLSATVSPQEAANKKVIWSTSNASVAGVDNGGKVTAVTVGSATITVKTDDGGKTATCAVTVNAKVYPVESVSLDKSSVELTEGETATLTAAVTPDNATDKTVFWSSSLESVATVTDGVITAVSAGEAAITVTTNDGGKTATCKVTVKASLPPGALPGEFSVSDTKKVHFSQGNLWYDGFEFMFEENQYDFANQWKSNHISHFNWTPYIESAVLQNFFGYGSISDIFFTNADETTASESFIVNVGGKEQKGWRTLSKDEWKYLFDVRKVKGNRGIGYSFSINITYGDKKGLVLYPDDYSGSALAPDTQYTVETFPKDCLFLPAAGYRDYNIEAIGAYGLYQSSSASTSLEAYCVKFLGDTVKPDDYTGFRSFGYCVRLVTEAK